MRRYVLAAALLASVAACDDGPTFVDLRPNAGAWALFATVKHSELSWCDLTASIEVPRGAENIVGTGSATFLRTLPDRMISRDFPISARTDGRALVLSDTLRLPITYTSPDTLRGTWACEGREGGWSMYRHRDPLAARAAAIRAIRLRAESLSRTAP